MNLVLERCLPRHCSLQALQVGGPRSRSNSCHSSQSDAENIERRCIISNISSTSPRYIHRRITKDPPKYSPARMLCHDTYKAFPGYQTRMRLNIAAVRVHSWFRSSFLCYCYRSSYSGCLGSTGVRLGCEYESVLKRSSCRHVDVGCHRVESERAKPERNFPPCLLLRQWRLVPMRVCSSRQRTTLMRPHVGR